MENHHFLMGKSTISMAIFNSILYVYQRVLRIQKRFEQSIRNSQVFDVATLPGMLQFTDV
jgi:hypothetical protein